MKQPRGIRNNNPLNIRKSAICWVGMDEDQSKDTEFVQFINMRYGFRAAAIVLRNYHRLYEINDIASVVSRWASKSENNTSKYIDIVCRDTGLKPDEAIDFNNPFRLAEILRSMAKVETGWLFPMDEVLAGVQLMYKNCPWKL